MKKQDKRVVPSIPNRMRLQDIRHSLLAIDERYQRKVREGWVREIAANFDPHKFEPLMVVRRADGTYWIVDGQHRWLALARMGYSDQLVTCLVMDSDSVQSEAADFIMRNGRRKAVRAIDLFRAAVAAGQEDECVVTKVLNDLGLTASDSQRDRNVAAVSTVLKIYRTDKRSTPDQHRLRDIMRTARDAWNSAAAGFDSIMLQALHLLRMEHGDDLPRDFAAKIGGGDPALLITNARASAKLRGTSSVRELADTLRNRYDKGRRGPSPLKRAA